MEPKRFRITSSSKTYFVRIDYFDHELEEDAIDITEQVTSSFEIHSYCETCTCLCSFVVPILSKYGPNILVDNLKVLIWLSDHRHVDLIKVILEKYKFDYLDEALYPKNCQSYQN